MNDSNNLKEPLNIDNKFNAMDELDTLDEPVFETIVF